MAPHVPLNRFIHIAALVVVAVLWLVLLQLSGFNVVAVSLGLLVVLAILDR